MVLQTSYHDTVNDLQERDFASPGPFAGTGWFAQLERAGNPARIVLVRDGAAAFALPLAPVPGRRKVLTSLTNWYAFSWQPLATAGLRDQMPMAVAAARALRAHARQIVLLKIPQEGEIASLLAAAFRAAGWIARLERCDVNHVLHLRGRSYADYLATRPGQLRNTLKRRAKKVDVSIIAEFQNDVWDIYEQIYGSSWKPQEGDAAMLRHFAETEGRGGRLRMAIAREGDVAVAVQFWTVQNGIAWIHKLAHLETARQLSPGTTLTAALMQHVIDYDGVHTVDFGTGDDTYKRDWMEEIRPRYRLQCWRPEAPANWLPLAARWLRNLVSRLPAG